MEAPQLSLYRWTGALALVLLTACGKVDISWEEQVRLNDNQIIVVQRSATGETRGEIGGPGGWEPYEMTISFSHVPHPLEAPPEWRSHLAPVLIDYEPLQRAWNVVATFVYCQAWYDLGKPAVPYIQYQSRDGRDWVTVPLEERLIGRDTNLLTGPRSGGEPELVRLEEKERRRKRAASSFRSISINSRNNC